MVNQDISFSILMANYNNAEYIEEAILSVLKQTYLNWELIIVDDCSTDNSLELINKYLEDKRIKLIKKRKNQGYGSALKTAAQKSSNKVIGILDADDKLHENALKIMAETYHNNPEFGFFYSTMWECDSDLKNCVVCKWIGPIIPKKTNIFNSRISHFKTFLKESYLKTSGFDPKQKKGVDRDIVYKLEEVTNFKFINTPLYYYRSHSGGISQAKNHYKSEFYLYYAKLKAYQRRINSKIPNLTRRQIYFEYYRIVIYQFSHLIINFCKRYNISNLIKNILTKDQNLPPIIQKLFKMLRRLN